MSIVLLVEKGIASSATDYSYKSRIDKIVEDKNRKM